MGLRDTGPLLTSLEVDTAVEACLDALQGLFGADSTLCFVYDHELESCVLRGMRGESGTAEIGTSFVPGVGFRGEVLQSGTRLFSQKWDASDRMRFNAVHRELENEAWAAWGSVAFAPIVDDSGAPYALLELRWRHEKEGDWGEIESQLGWFAFLFSITLQNCRIYQPTEKRARYYDGLFAVTESMQPSLPLRERLERVAMGLRCQFNSEAALVYLTEKHTEDSLLLEAQSNSMKPEQVDAFSMEVHRRARRASSMGVIGHVHLTQEGVVANDLEEAEDWEPSARKELCLFTRNGRLDSFLGVPLIVGQHRYGVLVLVNKRPRTQGHRDWFTHQDAHFLEDFARHLALLLEHQDIVESLRRLTVAALELQKVAAFGTFAERIPSRVISPLQGSSGALKHAADDLKRIETRDATGVKELVDQARSGISEALEELAFAGHFSEAAGFAKVSVDLNNLIKDLLLLTDGERRAKRLSVRWYPQESVSIIAEPNELFVTLWVVLRTIFDASTGEGDEEVEIEIQATNDPRGRSIVVRAGGEERFLSAIRQRVLAAEEDTTSIEHSVSLLLSAAQRSIERTASGTLTVAQKAAQWVFRLSLPENQERWVGLGL